MRKVLKRLVAAFFVILMLVSLFPFQVFAVDPVSAATMANAMAQALTAYGAGHGVSMMFDVTNTDGIGEGMHDLWQQFKADINDNNVPTYDSLAVTLWADLYTKVSNKVAINVSAENVEFFDRFWNWLLSGPAQMQKVDDQYYEWTINQNNTVDPINVYSQWPFSPVPVLSSGLTNAQYYQQSIKMLPDIGVYSETNPMYALIYIGAANEYRIAFASSQSDYGCIARYYGPNSITLSTFNLIRSTSPGTGVYIWFKETSYYTMTDPGGIIYQSKDDAIASFIQFSNNPVPSDSIDIRPYVGDTVPQNVPIPDTDDPDYAPLPYVGPLGVSWIDNNFGDGETMTDAQRESIAGALDDVIEDDGTLTLEEDQTVPDNPSGEVIGGPSAYTVPGLADVFPFCIPFDIYHFLQALAADPTPPHFTAQFAFPQAVGGTMRIDLDFDTPTFNQIAAILRTMELLAFCVGLALLTRSMFIRG